MTLIVQRRRFEDQNTSFLLRDFEDFYLKLLSYKTIILHSAVSSEEVQMQSPQEISDELREMLQRMSLEAAQKGGEYAAGYYQEAMYIMAALADEFFLNFDWAGRTYWADNLLESRLFSTHDAGDLFFRNLDDFLRARDPIRYDLAELYLLALGLGFQGKYRNLDDQGRLKAYRTKLFIFIYHHELPEDIGSQRLFPEVYGYTLEEGKPLYLQDLRQWMMAFAAVFLTIFLLSIGVWEKTTSRLKSVIEHISSLPTMQE